MREGPRFQLSAHHCNISTKIAVGVGCRGYKQMKAALRWTLDTIIVNLKDIKLTYEDVFINSVAYTQ